MLSLEQVLLKILLILLILFLKCGKRQCNKSTKHFISSTLNDRACSLKLCIGEENHNHLLLFVYSLKTGSRICRLRKFVRLFLINVKVTNNALFSLAFRANLRSEMNNEKKLQLRLLLK